MSYSLKILPVAQKDLREAKEWYDKKQVGLGDEFRLIVNTKIDDVGKYSHHFQRRYKGLRLSLVKRFPYAIFYLIDDERELVIIFGILHTSRNPEVARTRLK